MRVIEKRFICDIASIILALGALVCTVLLFLNYALFYKLTPMVFGCGAMMFLALFFRNCLGKNRGRMMLYLLFFGVLAAFTLIAVFFPGGVK